MPNPNHEQDEDTLTIEDEETGISVSVPVAPATSILSPAGRSALRVAERQLDEKLKSDKTLVVWRRRALSRAQRAAWAETKDLFTQGASMGKRRMVSMQALEQAGLVSRIVVRGKIVDWAITSDGMEWKG